MRLVFGLAIAALAAGPAFGQSESQAGTPAGTSPPSQTKPASSDSRPNVGVAVDVDELVKGFIKAVRKPPKADAPAPATAEDPPAPAEPPPATPVEAAIVTPATLPAPAPELAPPSTPPAAIAQPEPAPRPGQAPSRTPAGSGAAPTPLADAVPVRAAPEAAAPVQAETVAPVASPAPESRAPEEERSAGWLLLIMAAVAAAGAAALRRRRILNRTRAMLAWSARLEPLDRASWATPIQFASPPISIRARLEPGSA